MLPSGKKNNVVEEQLVNGNGQINIGRQRPRGEIRGVGGSQHQGPSPLAHLALCCPSYHHSNSRPFFILRLKLSNCQVLGLLFSGLEEKIDLESTLPTESPDALMERYQGRRYQNAHQPLQSIWWPSFSSYTTTSIFMTFEPVNYFRKCV